MMHSPRASNRRYLPSSPFKPPPEEAPAEQYELDDLVDARQVRLRTGVLVESGAVVVDFGPKKMRITAPFARMSEL